MENKPVAFLSSMTWEFSGIDNASRKSLSRLRRRAWDQNRQHLWVAECIDGPSAEDSHMEIMDQLLSAVRETRLFICLLGGSRRGRDEHGSLIHLQNRISAVSFFEAELFMAALLQKPIRVFVTKDFDPGPRLASLLALLDFAFPKHLWKTQLTDDQVIGKIGDEIDQLLIDGKSQRWLSRFKESRIRSRVVSHKYQQAISNGRPLGSRPVLFLSGIEETAHATPDRDLIEILLSEEQQMNHSDPKLGRLWLAIRELAKRPAIADRSGDFLALWNIALKRWGDAAGWSGLHGHIDLSFAASAFSMAQVRQLMIERSVANVRSSLLEYPGGAIASSLYSTAKWMPTSKGRNEMLRDGYAHLMRSRTERSTLSAGLAHMLGSYHIALGEVREGTKYFTEALRLAEIGQGSLGVSHSELGTAYIRQGRFLLGLDHLKTGVELLNTDSNGKSGAYARALRNLMYGYAANGRLVSAHRTRTILRKVTLDRGYYDQYR